MKNLLKTTTLIFISFFVLTACQGNVERNEVIAACENATDNNSQCKDCCVSNGYDTGSVDGFSDECECIDLVDD